MRVNSLNPLRFSISALIGRYSSRSGRLFVFGIAVFFVIFFVLVVTFLEHQAILKEAAKADEHRLANKVYRVALATDIQNDKLHYGIIVDCGSSGSSWPPHSGGTKDLLKIQPMRDRFSTPVTKKIVPGLSTFANKPDQASEYLKPLLEFAARHIPEEKHKETELFILATAGMRMLNTSAQEAILSDIRLDVRLDFKFLLPDAHVEVISGKQEGVYAWIALNYARGKLDHSLGDDPLVVVQLPGDEKKTHIRKRTLGVIDMGGASAQIAFEVPHSETVSKNLVAEFNLGCTSIDADHIYRVYVTTFLGYGGNSARERYEAMVANHILANTSSSIGLSESSPYSDPCLPVGMIDSFVYKTATIHVTGTGDFYLCERSLRPLLNQSVPCHESTCSMNGVFMPRIDLDNSEFYGFSEFFYSTEDVLRMSGRYDYQKFSKAASDYCSTRWTTLQSWYKRKLYPKADRNRFRLQCFKSAWISSVFHDGFHFPRNYKQFTTAQQLEGEAVQWTTGALLYKTRFYPLRDLDKKRRKPPSRYRHYHRPPWALPESHTSYALLILCLLVVIGAIILYLRRLKIVSTAQLRKVPSMAYFMIDPDQPVDGLAVTSFP